MSAAEATTSLNKEKFVLDACSLIALLRGEEGSELVAALLHRAEKDEVEISVHRVTIAEVYYDVLRSSGKEKADAILTGFEALRMNIVNTLDNAFLQRLGNYKVSYHISFADSFVLALAETKKATVVSSDHHEFDAIAQNDSLSFLWIR